MAALPMLLWNTVDIFLVFVYDKVVFPILVYFTVAVFPILVYTTVTLFPILVSAKYVCTGLKLL